MSAKSGTKSAPTPGAAVRALREQLGMTQAELAEACGMTQAEVCKVETGRDRLGVMRAEKLAQALCVHPSSLLWPLPES